VTIFYNQGGTGEKARVDSRTYSHVKEACTQKNASGRNCAEVEEDRGSDATKGFQSRIIARNACCKNVRTKDRSELKKWALLEIALKDLKDRAIYTG
jgi:hypothetical protein